MAGALVVGLEKAAPKEAASEPDMMAEESDAAIDAFLDASASGDKELARAAFKRAVMACSDNYSE